MPTTIDFLYMGPEKSPRSNLRRNLGIIAKALHLQRIDDREQADYNLLLSSSGKDVAAIVQDYYIHVSEQIANCKTTGELENLRQILIDDTAEMQHTNPALIINRAVHRKAYEFAVDIQEPKRVRLDQGENSVSADPAASAVNSETEFLSEKISAILEKFIRSNMELAEKSDKLSTPINDINAAIKKCQDLSDQLYALFVSVQALGLLQRFQVITQLCLSAQTYIDTIRVFEAAGHFAIKLEIHPLLYVRDKLLDIYRRLLQTEKVSAAIIADYINGILSYDLTPEFKLILLRFLIPDRPILSYELMQSASFDDTNKPISSMLNTILLILETPDRLKPDDRATPADFSIAIRLYKHYKEFYEMVKSQPGGFGINLQPIWNLLNDKIFNLLGATQGGLSPLADVQEQIIITRNSVNYPEWLFEYITETMLGQMQQLFEEREANPSGPPSYQLRKAQNKKIKLEEKSFAQLPVEQQLEALSQRLLFAWDKAYKKDAETSKFVLNKFDRDALEEQLQVFVILAPLLENAEVDTRNKILDRIRAIEHAYMLHLSAEELYVFKNKMLDLRDSFRGYIFNHVNDLANIIDEYYAEVYGKRPGYPPALNLLKSGKVNAKSDPDAVDAAPKPNPDPGSARKAGP